MNKAKLLSLFLALTLITGIFSACSEEKAPNTKQESGPEIIYDGGNYVYTVVDKNGDPVSKEIRDGVADYIKLFILDYYDDPLVTPINDSDILVGIHGYYEKEIAIRGYEGFGTLNFRDPEGAIRIDYTYIKNAEVLSDENTNEPYIAVFFTDEGKTVFETLTKELSRKPDGENTLGIYVGDVLFSSPKVTTPLSGGVAYITSELFLKTPEQATAFTNAINSEYSKNYTLKYSYEITPTEEEVAQWEKEEKASRKQAFLTAIAKAMTEQTGEKYYAKDIDNDLMSKYTSFISTLQIDNSTVEDAATQFGTYRPVIILGTSEYTKQYIADRYLTDLQGDVVESTPLDEHEHLTVEFDFEDVEHLELFNSLEVLDVSGYYPRSLYTNMYQQYMMYGSYSDASFQTSVLSLQQCYLSIDMTGLTSLKMIPNLDKIKYLSIGYSGITSLEGIDGAKHLEYLEAVGCGLTDIKAMAKTSTIKRIDLSYNELTSLKGIEGNNDLVVGRFNHNQLTSLDALSATAKMTNLYLVGNALVNLEGIEGNKNTLVNLYVGENVDNAVKEKAEEEFYAKYEDIYEDELNEDELAEMKEAEKALSLEGRTLVDISALNGFAALKVLSVYGNKIEDISCVVTMTVLESLTANDNLISSLPADMSGAESLKTINLSCNKLTSLDGVGTLEAIVSLDASNNEIADLGDIRNVATLTDLQLSDNSISDITSLRNLTGLVSLNLANNQISRLISLSQLTTLRTLDLAGNRFESISALRRLESVSEVNLSHNEMLTDISDFDSVFDSATLKKADFSASSTEGVESINLVIVDWTPIFAFEDTDFAGVPDDILTEIGK